MGTLTFCLSPAQSNLPKEDKDYIRERSKEYQDTDKLSAAESHLKAVEDTLSEYAAEHKDIIDQVEEAGGTVPEAWVLPVTDKVPVITKTKVKEPAPSKEKIQDFGEVLSGARKHYAEAYKIKMDQAIELDIVTEPLSRSWPEPDYQKLLDDGADSWVVGFVHSARDEVPSKPRVYWKLKGWVAQVEQLRGMTSKMLDGSYSKEALTEIYDKAEFRNLREAIGGRIDLYQEVGHGKSLKGVSFGSNFYSLYKGEKNVTKWVVEKKAKTTGFSNWPTEIAVGNSKEEALAKFKSIYESGALDSKVQKRQTTFGIYSDRRSKEVYIGKKIGRNIARLKDFPDVKTAREYLVDNQSELESLLAKYKDIPSERKAKNDPRVGVDHRNGADVTPEQFSEQFKFRGVQFGNYVEGGRRQSDLNNSYDALMDLAGVLGIPPESLSLNGTLGLAFGARGKGGKNAPAAHYEPGTIVINLTKRGGPGSLGHEWFHSLDNYFSLMRGKSGYMTELPFVTDGVRPEMVNAFKGIIQAIKKTGIEQRSSELDKRKTKAYWATGIEMSARSFESYVINKLQDQSQSNDYLANVVSEQAFDLEGGYPYPTAGEMPDIRAAFDHFFDAVQAKETDKGVALYSKKEAPAKAKKEETNPQSTTKQLTDKLLSGRFKSTVKKMLDQGKLVIVQSETDLPKTIDQRGTAGAFIGKENKIYFVADNVAVSEIESLLKHEGFHGASKHVLGTYQYDKMITRLKRLDKMKGEVADWFVEAKAAVPADTPNEYIYDEIAAYAVEQYRDAPKKQPKSIGDFVKAIVAAFRRGLVRLGMLPKDFTAEDLSIIAHSALKRFADAGDAGDAVSAYSREAPIFYSELTKAIQDIKQTLAPPAQWKAMIAKLGQKGVKAEEISWSGVDDWLGDQKGKVTKDDLVAYLKSQEVVVDEVVKTAQWEMTNTAGETEYFDSEKEASERIDQENEWVANEAATIEHEDGDYITVVSHEGVELYAASKGEDGEWVTDIDFGSEGLYDESEALEQAEKKAAQERQYYYDQVSDAPEVNEDGDGGKYAQWQMEGKKEGYRELLLTLPEIKRRQALSLDEAKKVIAAAGLVDIYRGGKLIDVLDGKYDYDKFIKSNLSGKDVTLYKTKTIGESDKYISSHYDETNILAHVRFNERTIGGKKTLFIEEIQSDWAQDLRKDAKVPDTPFKKTETWAMLAFKRMTRYAAENGFEQISWTSGEVQADRYDLSKQVDSVSAAKRNDGKYGVDITKDGNLVDTRKLDENELADFIGKDLANKITEDEDVQGGIRTEFSGLDLKVGGEGMSGFYDKILPKAVGKFAKKFGGKVSALKTVEGQEVWAIPITDKMRESALRGLPMFSKRRQKEAKADYTEEEQEAIEVGGFGVRKESSSKEAYEKLKDRFKTKMRQGIVDQYASIKEILKDDRAWMMAHLSHASTGGLEAIMQFGQPKLTDNALDVDTNKKSLQDILEPLGKDMDRFFMWMVGHRAAKLKAEDRERLFSNTNIKALQGMDKTSSVGQEVFESVRKDFEEMGDAINKIAVETGLVSKSEANAWMEESFYVPFYRMLEGETQGPRMFADQITKQTAYKKLKGANLQLDDPLTNVLLNWQHLLSASMKNQAAVKAFESAIKMGLAKIVTAKQKSKNAIWVRWEGKQVWVDIEDGTDGALILDSLMSLNYDGMNNLAMKSLRKFKRVLTIGVTLSPEFRVANLIRDSLHSIAVVGDKGMSTNIAKNVLTGWKDTKKGSPLHARMIASGGAFGDSGYIHGADPEAIKHAVSKGAKRDTILDARWRITKVFDAYQDFGARMENVNRAAQFDKKLKDVGLLEAAFSSRDLLDFSRTGSFPAVRFLTSAVPFLNARLQGLDKMGRAAMTKGERQRFFTVVAMYSLASVALYLSMKDDEDYKESEEWEKDAYHLFKIPGSEVMFRLPRPFEVGAIANLAERAVEQIVNDEVHGELFAERLWHTINHTLQFNPMPQAFMPALEVFANKNTFTERPIESMSMRNLPAADRKRAWTSETAIALSAGMDSISWGKIVLSPVQIQHLVNGYLGWAGAQTLEAVDMLAMRPIISAPDRPAKKITEYIGLKRFMREAPNRNTKYTTQFYEDLQEIRLAYNSIRNAKKLKELDKAIKLRKEHREKLKWHKAYNVAQKQLSAINKRMDIIHRSSRTPEVKRMKIDKLISRRNEITKRITEKADIR